MHSVYIYVLPSFFSSNLWQFVGFLFCDKNSESRSLVWCFRAWELEKSGPSHLLAVGERKSYESYLFQLKFAKKMNPVRVLYIKQ